MNATQTNTKKVLSVLSVKGPRSSKELAKDTDLTLSQVKYATHELKQTDKLGLNANGDWYELVSKLERFLTVRPWNGLVFAEAAA
jgi:hypothetical protein